MSPGEEEDVNKVDATWYQMNIFVPEHYLEKHVHHSELFEACVIREAIGELLDDPNENLIGSKRIEKLNFNGRAMVGLTVNQVEWLQLTTGEELIPDAELEEMYYKMKIYACNDQDATYVSGG